MLTEIVTLVRTIRDDISKQKYDELYTSVVKLAYLTYQDYKCWKDAIVSLTKQVVIGLGDQRQCIMEHLQAAGAEIKAALHEILHGHTDHCIKHLNKAFDIISDISNCQ